MREWLFDLGNTRLKYAQNLHEVHYLAHQQPDWLAELPDEVHGETAWVSSVASSVQRQALLAVLLERFARVSFARTSARAGRLRIAYAHPEKLGVDRFLALLAASMDAQPMLIVGVGTALTVDLLTADGHHLGGKIAPSPSLMRQSLHTRAAQLPLAGGMGGDFADNTLDALAAGCQGAALALIETSRQQAAARLGTPPTLCLHGGGAEALLPNFPDARHQPHLVLAGLAQWASCGNQA
ncbi:pantothenate kinase [Lysobacteraceae bacterium NML03-0222]|nr:pantothenate kinase [Xanthomonadaceae bacterium NML03-0222]